MTVGTYDVALGDLFLDKAPRQSLVGHARHIAPFLASHVIELQNDPIALGTIRASRSPKNRNHAICILGRHSFTTNGGYLFVLGFVFLVITLRPGVTAASADVVESVTLGLVPIELGQQFSFPTWPSTALGAPDRNRTRNPAVKSGSLCQLSYRGKHSSKLNTHDDLKGISSALATAASCHIFAMAREIATLAQDLLPTQLYTSFAVSGVNSNFATGDLVAIAIAGPNQPVKLAESLTIGDLVLYCEDFSPALVIHSGVRILDPDMADSGAVRPSSPSTGQMFYDTGISRPIWWSGAAWLDATGTPA